MSWMQQLTKVYTNNIDHVGEFQERRNQRITLLPVSHVMQSAQIEILINDDGEFESARVIEKENARTIVPATPDSANRAGAKVAPHYLHDGLHYVAGDYVAYSGETKREKHYQGYLKQMKEWAESPNAPKKVKAIYRYIKKGNVIEDLINEKIIPADSNNEVITKWTSNEERPLIYKVVPGDILSAFVRFDVLHDTADDPVVWEDKRLFKGFIDYLETIAVMETGYCYVTGEETLLTTQHGSRIRNAGDMSKLISANDSSGYTYRGRFAKPTEAVQIGYDVSQKAHHALRWLLQKQGTYVDSRYFVSFGVEEAEVADPLDGTENHLFDFFSAEMDEDAKPPIYTEEIVAEELNKALQGRRHKLEEEELENIIIMSVDAATPGRLAVVYYQQQSADLYYEALTHWHQTCIWRMSFKNDNKWITFEGAPSTYQIAEAVYGRNGDPRMKKELYTRLLPSIVEKKAIPRDIVQTLFNRVKNPFSFDRLGEWNSVLNIACALINKQYEEEGFTVSLQEGNSSRDYLFGRLLGIAEVMEERLLKEREENRAANATRYFNAFSQHPARTWMVIRKQLNPYFQRSGGQTGYYAMLIQQIEARLAMEDMTDVPLSPVFLLGYSSQIQSLYTKKEENKNDSVAE